MLFCFKGNLVRMSCFHYINMFHTHFTHSFHKGCCIKKSMFYTFWMVYVVSLSVCVWSYLSLITVYICFTDLTLNQFPWQLSLIQLPKIVHFAFATLKLCPFPTGTAQCVETPAYLGIQKCVVVSSSVLPSQNPLSSETVQCCPLANQPTLLSRNAQSSLVALHLEIV